MKKQFRLLFVLAAIVVGSGFVQAQTKIGYVSSDSLLLSMPETAEAKKKLEAEQQIFIDEIQKMNTELMNLQNDYQKAASDKSTSPAILELKGNKIGDQEQRIQDFQQKAQDAVSKKQQELFAPIIEKIKKAIAEVAKEKGYTYVLDASLGVILYSVPQDDLMDAVKKKLTIK